MKFSRNQTIGSILILAAVLAVTLLRKFFAGS